MAGRTPCTATPRARTPSPRRKTLCLSPEDDLRPPARKTLSVSPYEGEDLVLEVERNTGPCVSPLRRGEQEGSCIAGILRFPHRLIAPRFAAEHRAPAGLSPQSLVSPQSFKNVQTQGSQYRREPRIRGHAGGETGA